MKACDLALYVQVTQWEKKSHCLFEWFSTFSKHFVDKGKHQRAKGDEKLLLHKQKQLRILKLGLQPNNT